MANTVSMLASSFVCSYCDHRGTNVEKLAMTGTDISRLLEIQHHRYTFASCQNCGYTEIYNLRTLNGKDNLGKF